MLRNRHALILGCAFLIFVACLGMGFSIAQQKPLWNDEIFSQISSVNNRSYFDIFISRNTAEGTATPLFYFTQKMICNIFNFTILPSWKEGIWDSDFKSRMILRIHPVFFMSLSIALIFYFFVRYYSWPTGLYALCTTLSSFMVWSYWAEARSYALWFFLTTAQSLLFIFMASRGKIEKTPWRLMVAVNFLLAFTTIFGIFQITLASALLWFFTEKNWKRYLVPTLTPVAICLFYYALSPKYGFQFVDSPMQLVNASIPKDRFLIIALFAFALLLYYFREKFRFRKVFNGSLLLKGMPYFVFLAGMLGVTAGILFLFKMNAMHYERGFRISNRYFIFLASMGIIAATLFSDSLVRSLKDKKLLQVAVMIILGILLLVRFRRIYGFIFGYFT